MRMRFVAAAGVLLAFVGGVLAGSMAVAEETTTTTTTTTVITTTTTTMPETTTTTQARATSSTLPPRLSTTTSAVRRSTTTSTSAPADEADSRAGGPPTSTNLLVPGPSEAELEATGQPAASLIAQTEPSTNDGGEGDRTRNIVMLVTGSLVTVASLLILLTVWYWRHTKPAAPREGGDQPPRSGGIARPSPESTSNATRAVHLPGDTSSNG